MTPDTRLIEKGITLAAELRAALDDPKRYEWGDGPWEHLGDAEKDVRLLLTALDELVAERDRLREAQVTTEIVGGIMALEAERDRYKQALRDARRELANIGRWAGHPDDPTERDWALVVTECEQAVARIDAALDDKEQS